MSFRRRLIFTLVLLLLIPVGATALLAANFANDSKTSQADARISGALPSVTDLYGRSEARAEQVAVRIASSQSFSAAVAGADAGIRAELTRVLVAEGLTSLRLARPSAEPIVVGGQGIATGSAQVITGPSPPSELSASLIDPEEFVTQAERLSGLRVVLWVGEELVSNPAKPPLEVSLEGSERRTVDAEGKAGDLRARVFTLREDSGPMLRIAVLAPKPGSALSEQGLQIAIILVLFLVLAVVLLTPLFRDLQSLHDRAEHQAITDDLTGVSNRRHFKRLFDREIHRSRRFGHDVSVILLDIDDFKRVNDTYGHSVGDEILKEVAERIGAESRNSDDLARYGGEEFIVALPETAVSGAMHQAERIRERIASQPFATSAGEIQITASIGVAGTPAHRPEISSLFEAADAALYQAKRQGKNRVISAPPRDLSPAPLPTPS